jgi:hypothetical protein
MEEGLMDNIRKNWVLIAAFFFVSAAWGQVQVKITDLDTAVKSNAVVHQQVVDLKIQNARIEEQLKTVKESQRTQEDLLRSISSDIRRSQKPK